jgi:hypothetical protein
MNEAFVFINVSPESAPGDLNPTKIKQRRMSPLYFFTFAAFFTLFLIRNLTIVIIGENDDTLRR